MNCNALKWLASGRVGISSKAMVCKALGLPLDRWGGNHPHDPDDFNRCLMMLVVVPEVRGSFHEIATISLEWKALISRWDEVEQTFINEVGLDWCNSHSAPKTYALMKQIFREAS